MTSIFQATDRQVESVPEEESAQPIAIRMLDRLETTSASFANGG